MGCFFGCFGSSKHSNNKRKVLRNGSSNGKQEQPTVSLVPDCSKNAVNPIPQLLEKSAEQLSVSSRKKVTFDSNVKTYEPSLVDEVEERKNEDVGKEEALVHPKSSSSEDNSCVSSTGSYPPNHRYQNCRDSEDEEEEIDYGDSDLSDEDDDVIREECKELGQDFGEDGTVATIAADHVFSEEVDVKSIESNLNARDRSAYVHPVLKPVENLTQWKVVKSKKTPLRPQKEYEFGEAVEESPFSLKSESDTPKKLNQEIPVDASLSNWLVSPETTPVNKAGSVTLFPGTPDRSTPQSPYSVLSHEDRPILGALTLEEIKQFSATSSPRKSPSRSPDEMPIIGTVGTYWNFAASSEGSGSASSFKGIPNSTSKYREDKRVNWHSTPFETRLEKALNRGAASYVPRVF
ncbi:uncharacterized protein LOC106772124 isoform X1 [Vigna radiata var. radiata]|uniref:Uncharacterized protein LOC106772124 isoform X1 n=1 Tax=Vigna radiata var. radiata TaxID=3916 RepID=A0A1S3V670_VIGRR|nr:uncharacterized protein LOC106772124 isoform X1 [Vigna radiata var. radiata]